MIAIISKLSKSKFVRRLKKGDAANMLLCRVKKQMFVKQEGKKTKANIPLVMLKVFTEDYIHSNQRPRQRALFVITAAP
jgi:hypothetical protein